MRKANDDLERIDEAFREARSELGRIGSSRDEIERRIASTSIKRSPKIKLSYALATLALLALASVHRWRAGNPSPLPHVPVVVPTRGWGEESRIEIGDTELTAYIAAIIDHRDVVVIWSYRGNGMAASPSNGTECPAGKYQSATLREVKLANGRTLVCSLLIPDADVRPILEPPSIYTRSGEKGIVALSVSPRIGSTEELTDAIRSAGADGTTGIGVDEILREIQKRSH